MNKNSTSVISELYSLASLILLLLISSCTARVDSNMQDQAEQPEAVANRQQEAPVIVAATEAPNGEAYFDLVAETSGCLGENVWIAGKVKSAEKMIQSRTGALRTTKVYEVTDLTATGLNSNHNYICQNSNQNLQAVADNKGNVYIQLRQGELQLQPQQEQPPVLVAYTASATQHSWSCQ